MLVSLLGRQFCKKNAKNSTFMAYRVLDIYHKWTKTYKPSILGYHHLGNTQLGTTRIWVHRGALWRLGSSIATAACSFHGGSMEGLDGFGMGKWKGWGSQGIQLRSPRDFFACEIMYIIHVYVYFFWFVAFCYEISRSQHFETIGSWLHLFLLGGGTTECRRSHQRCAEIPRVIGIAGWYAVPSSVPARNDLNTETSAVSALFLHVLIWGVFAHISLLRISWKYYIIFVFSECSIRTMCFICFHGSSSW